MKPIPVLAALVAAGLPCSGLCGGAFTSFDPEEVGNIVGALENVDPSQAPLIFAAGAAEANLVSGDCKELFVAAAHAAPDQREILLSGVYAACEPACPTPAMVMNTAPGVPADQRTAAVVRACAPDPVFGGALAPVAGRMDVHTYVAYRHLYEAVRERLEGTAPGDALWRRFDRTRPMVALALAEEAAEREPSWGLATPPLAVHGALAEADVAARLRAAEPGLGDCVEDPTEGGRLLVDLVVGRDGAVWAADARESTVSRVVARCVVDKARGVSFAVPSDGELALVTWPVTLGGSAYMGLRGSMSPPGEVGLGDPNRSAPSGPAPRFGGGGGEGGTVAAADAVVMGSLDKSLIDAVLKRNMNQIRYCYQRELTKVPDLAGKVTVKFVIAKDGTVSSATTKDTTLKSPAVESCINGRFLRMQFPEPKGGGIVIVSYPFVFQPA